MSDTYCSRSLILRATPNYGNCFSFNALSETDPQQQKRRTAFPGPDFGLSLVLNLEQLQYMRKSLTKAAGARFTNENKPELTYHSYVILLELSFIHQQPSRILTRMV